MGCRFRGGGVWDAGLAQMQNSHGSGFLAMTTNLLSKELLFQGCKGEVRVLGLG